MLNDIFSLGGLVAFLLGVFLGTWVKSLVGQVSSKVGG
jgi:hypothetical protein